MPRPHRNPPPRRRIPAGLVCLLLVLTGSIGRSAAGDPESLRPVLVSACGGCHDAANAAGGLSLEALWDGDGTVLRADDAVVRDRLVRMHDRIVAGEMPPEPEDLPADPRRELVATLAAVIDAADFADIRDNGRVPLRRLNRHELEQALRTLLELPDLDVADLLPEDRLRDGFPKSAAGLELSRIQMEGTLDAIDAALAAALAPSAEPPAMKTFTAISKALFGGTAYGEPEAFYFAKDSRPVDAPAPDDAGVEAVVFRSAYWPYHGYPAGFVAARSGRYRVRFRARAVLQQPDRTLLPATAPVPMTFRARAPSGPDVSGDVKAVGGLFDVGPEASDHETTVRLRAGQTIEWSLLGLAVPLARNVDGGPPTYRFPPPPPGGHPGIAFSALEIVGPLPPADGSWPPPSHRVLFGDLPIRAAATGPLAVEVIPTDPTADARRLLRRFAGRLFGRGIADDDVAGAERVVQDALAAGDGFAAALLAGYRVLVASPEFLFVADPHGGGSADGQGDARALARRLSFFLWNDSPDPGLVEAAAQGGLATGIAAEAERLIDDPRFDRFVTAFTDHWLDLDRLRRDEPDARFVPEYRFDDYLVESLGRETREFVRLVLRENHPVTALVDGEFVLLNDRLAVHYAFPPVAGSTLRPVPRPAGSPRGGLLTQGAILKVTANGTSTSPVKRGAWVMTRLLGDPPPPPPEKVPAVEPDIRGATSIRDLLARHTADATCAACHRRFDPVGFALEAFDVCGGERTRYRGVAPPGGASGTPDVVIGIDRAGHDFAFSLGAPIDTSGALPDGSRFDDIGALKTLLARRPRQIARHLVGLWTAYATGGPVRFSDRRHVEAILDAAEAEEFRLRDLLLRFVASPIFTGAPAGAGGEP